MVLTAPRRRDFTDGLIAVSRHIDVAIRVHRHAEWIVKSRVRPNAIGIAQTSRTGESGKRVGGGIIRLRPC